MAQFATVCKTILLEEGRGACNISCAIRYCRIMVEQGGFTPPFLKKRLNIYLF